MGKLKAVGLGVKALEDAFKAEQAAEKMYTAADRARAGNKAAELIKTQPQVKASEALGQTMEKGFKKVSTTQSDRTRVGGGNIGGANFSAISEADPEYARKVWGVMDEGTAKRLTNLSSPETAWTTMLGSATQLKTNPVVFDKLKKQFLAAMKEGKLSKELESKINHNLELTFGEGADIRDPKIWKEANTFEKRAALADVMMGQGIAPKKGGVALGGEKSGKGVIFKPTETLIEETEPSLLHPEHGGSAETFALGPRLFNLSGTAEMRPDLHPGFPTLLHGKDLGYNFAPVPTEVFLPDWHAGFKKKNPTRDAGYYDLALGLKGEGLPSQDLHDEYIRHLIREGYADGGEVNMGKGGLLSKGVKALEEAMAKLPKGSEAAKEKIEREFAEEAARKDALYKVDKPSGEVGNRALAEARQMLSKQPPVLKVKPPSDNVLNVRQSNFNHSRTIGNQTVNIDDLSGGVRLSDPNERKRVDELASRISSPDGYISRIIVDQDNNVIEGQHRLEALRQLGVQDVPVYKIEDLEATMPVRKMEEAMNSVGSIHSDHVHQLMDHALQHISEVGLDEARKMNYGRFQPYYDAALNAIESKAHGGVVHMAEGSGVTRPRKYVPPSQLIPIASQEFPLQKPANVTEADMTPTELHPLAGALSRGVANVHDFVSKPFGYENPPMEMASELIGLPAISKTLENYAYGTPNTKGSGQATRLNEEAVDAAMSLPFGSGQTIKAGVKGAVKGAKELAPTAGKLAQEFAESTQFGLPFELNVVKPKGGNWTTSLSPVRDLKRKDFYGKTPEEQLIKYNEFFNNPELVANTLPEEIAILENKRQTFTNQAAINKWLDTKLTSYIKNEMATPEDPVRLGMERRLEEAQKIKEANDKKLAKMKEAIDKRKAEGKDVTLSQRDYDAAKEKADEENIFANKSVSHMTAPSEGWANTFEGMPVGTDELIANRVKAGYPKEGMAKTHPSNMWEYITDEAIEINPASKYINKDRDEKIRKSGGTPTIDVEPWIAKVAEKDPNTPIYYANNTGTDHHAEFRHMIDELQEAMNPNSKLPNNLKITAKDLEKMTVDDVSALSGKISAWRDIQKTKIDKDVANNPAMHTFKEYTENNPKGVKWQQIKRPEGYSDSESEKYVRAATQYEGDLMRHCVGGSGHCDPLLDGEVEIYTLRDAKGEPHVTIEVSTKVDPQAKGNTPKDFYLSMPMEAMAKLPPMPSPTNASFADITYWERKVRQTPQYQAWLQSRPKDIGEIKGKGNKKPNEEYIPFIQDFIRSGNWGNIRDIQNTDLHPTKNASWRKQFEGAGINVPDYISEPEYRALNEQYQSKKNNKGINMKAEGGAVQSPNNFDYESHVNNIMNAHNASNFDYEGHVKKIMGMAEGGAAYNTNPDMSDGGLYIQAPAFKIGGRIPLLTR